MPLAASVRAYLALGSNLGDRLMQMQAALEALAADDALCVCQVSPVYENRAVGMGEANPFLNAMAEVATTLPPLALLDRCLEVETELGRTRSGDWAPRTIDIDIIAYDDASIESDRLSLPHPRITERDFVMHPLNDIAPELRIHGQRVADLAPNLPMDALRLCEATLRIE